MPDVVSLIDVFLALCYKNTLGVLVNLLACGIESLVSLVILVTGNLPDTTG